MLGKKFISGVQKRFSTVSTLLFFGLFESFEDFCCFLVSFEDFVFGVFHFISKKGAPIGSMTFFSQTWPIFRGE